MTPFGTPPADWLLAHGDPWVQYRTRIDLLDQSADDPDVQHARAAMLSDPRVRALIDGLHDWPGVALKRHNQSEHPIHQLALLATMGLRHDDPGISAIIARVLDHQDDAGPFQIAVQVKWGKNASDEPVLTWMLCDAPLVLWSLITLGVDDPRIDQAATYLVGLVRDNGWPCVTDDAVGFRGPGRKADPCPYANLLMVRALAAYGAERLPDPTVVQSGVEMLLHHWAHQRERKLYLFGIGTDFRKPKFPLVWYDIVHMIDVLSRFPAARADARYQAMLGELMAQADDEGRFTARSMYRPWKEWEFANKKTPSPAITLIAWRAALRGDGV
ncbi:MAG: hypothetical protein K8S97_11430 [Anaerolineae bacterium]|nr:hypothetical protein [Anaerolineae bacterium]